MSTKTRTIEQRCCDLCGDEAYEWNRCLNCGKDLCRKCQVSYPHAVSFSGSGDGSFCPECDKALKLKPTPIFAAYRAIEQLRAECEAFYADFKKRDKVAQQRIKELRAELGVE